MNYQAKLGLMLNYIFSNLLPDQMIEKFSEIIFSDNVIQYQLRNHILADADSIHMSMRIRDYEITIAGLLYSAETFPEFLDIICPNLWFEARDRIIHNFNQLCDRLLFLFNFDTLDKEKIATFYQENKKACDFMIFLSIVVLPKLMPKLLIFIDKISQMIIQILKKLLKIKKYYFIIRRQWKQDRDQLK
jgi:hypothetical protein